MQTPSAEWTSWTEILSRFRLKGLVGWLLDVGEPFMLIGAQLLYLGQPLTGSSRVTTLAQFLENEEETRAFAAFLRKE